MSGFFEEGDLQHESQRLLLDSFLSIIALPKDSRFVIGKNLAKVDSILLQHSSCSLTNQLRAILIEQTTTNKTKTSENNKANN